MSILVERDTRVLVQGITGTQGRLHTEQMLKDGTRIVAGVTPGKAGRTIAGVPVFNSVREAKRKLGIKAPNWSIGFVPAPFVKAAAFEALDAGLNMVIISEHVPVHDSLTILARAKANKRFAIGPNCPGIITPGQTKLGIMPAEVFSRGEIGVVSRSGTLTYEVVSHLSKAGLGQSTCIGIGGDPINLTSLEQALILFEHDPKTRAIVLIAEIGGSSEEDVALRVIGHRVTKPLVAFLAGRSAPVGKQLGHAGAIIEGTTGSVLSKERALIKAGVHIARQPWTVPKLLSRVL
ncbi:MAG: succinate--CoA ligase subunit alpha [Parcubacteria group bacterium]